MKVLVNIYIPAISKKYDVLIPENMKIRAITPLIAKTVENLSNHLYVASGEESLCSVEKNITLNPNVTLENYGIQNGDHIVML